MGEAALDLRERLSLPSVPCSTDVPQHHIPCRPVGVYVLEQISGKFQKAEVLLIMVDGEGYVHVLLCRHLFDLP